MIYEKALAEPIMFDNCDVITTSGMGGGKSGGYQCSLGLFEITDDSCFFGWFTD